MSHSETIRLMLVDDHGITRQGLRSMLDELPDLQVVGEAANGREAVACALECQPDIVITDISMPMLNGIDAAREIVNACGTIKVIALSIHSDRLFVSDMLKAGARGYVLKDSLFDELLDAIHTVMQGGIYLSPKIAGVVVCDYVKRLDCQPDLVESPLDALSIRQREVLQLISEGYTTKEIAHQLSISTKAVEASRRKIMDKLDRYTIAELVKMAIVGGLTTIDSE